MRIALICIALFSFSFNVQAHITQQDSLEVAELLEQAKAIVDLQYDSTPGTVKEYVFEVPYLKGFLRKVRVYTPARLSETFNYSVIYMHDGQNLFEDSTSFVGEWHVDETLDSLRKNFGRNYIVVGIDNIGEYRMQEYNPFDNERFGKGYGKEYVEWIANTLGPIIDSMYPINRASYSRAVMGSSMGGLISHYALLRYPNVFGAAGIFSPSYWICDTEFTEFQDQFLSQSNPMVYMLAGGKEGRSTKKLTKKHYKILKKQHPKPHFVKRVYDRNGMHNEQFWSKYLADAFVFLLVGY